MPPNYHGIALLLSLGALPLACTKETNDTDDGPTTTTITDGASDTTAASGATGTQPTTGDTGDTTTTTTTTNTPGDEDSGGTAPQQTTFLTTNTTADSTEGDTFGDTEDLPPPTDPVCLAYAAHMAECNPRDVGSREYLAQYCEYLKGTGLAQDGPPCEDALDALFVCFSALDCEAFEQEDPSNCKTESAAFAVACPTLNEDEDTDTGFDTDSDTGFDPETGGSTG